MLKHLLVALAVAMSALAGTAYAQPVVDDMCTRFLDNNGYLCSYSCDDYTSGQLCVTIDTTSPGHFEAYLQGPGLMTCSCDNRITRSGIEFNESHSFLCVLAPDDGGTAAFDGTVNRSINFDGNFFDGEINCTLKCRLDPSCAITG